VDNAYGQPFPGVIFRPESMIWNEHVIHTFSLSKLGLPATRTGIVVASPEIIRRISAMNAVLVLATSSIGQTIVKPLFETGELSQLCREVIRPFYEARSLQAREWIADCFDDRLDYQVHVGEGAFFLWLWFRGLPIGDRELYARLKARKVLAVPGSYFFPGLSEPWTHTRECLRMSYCTHPDALRSGIEIIADEVRRAYGA
jgi:valine--pyruvate aminotransferase